MKIRLFWAYSNYFLKATYGHVKEDLEANIVPIHIHVEAEITKGKYHDYDTFLGPEAAHFLKLYIQQRKQGIAGKPPETLTDDAPLIRDDTRDNRFKLIGQNG